MRAQHRYRAVTRISGCHVDKRVNRKDFLQPQIVDGAGQLLLAEARRHVEQRAGRAGDAQAFDECDVAAEEGFRVVDCEPGGRLSPAITISSGFGHRFHWPQMTIAAAPASAERSTAGEQRCVGGIEGVARDVADGVDAAVHADQSASGDPVGQRRAPAIPRACSCDRVTCPPCLSAKRWTLCHGFSALKRRIAHL